jgi:hypothetical protein
MTDTAASTILLEDEDGAPFPEPVQAACREIVAEVVAGLAPQLERARQLAADLEADNAALTGRLMDYLLTCGPMDLSVLGNVVCGCETCQRKTYMCSDMRARLSAHKATREAEEARS